MSLATYPYGLGRRAGGPTSAPPRPLRSSTRALVIHGADVVRLGISTMLASGSGCEVDGASSVQQAFRVAAGAHPELVLFDYRAADGAEVCRLLTALWPRSRLIALAGRDGGVAAADCLAAGADAAIQIDGIRREGFLAVVRRVMDGLGPLVAGFPPPAPASTFAPAARDSLASLLTPREREMLYLIGQGLSNREIAETLVLSVKTVEGHRANLARKLNVRSRAGLMRLALTGELAAEPGGRLDGNPSGSSRVRFPIRPATPTE